MEWLTVDELVVEEGVGGGGGDDDDSGGVLFLFIIYYKSWTPVLLKVPIVWIVIPLV